jgi:hypothetical protein
VCVCVFVCVFLLLFESEGMLMVSVKTGLNKDKIVLAVFERCVFVCD